MRVMGDPQHPLRFSVIIPTYHRPGRLRDAVLSLCVQAQLPDEIVVAAHSSDAESLHVLGHLEKEVEAVGIDWRVVFEPVDSMMARQNAAITHATGDIVAFLDDDAAARRDWLQRLATHYADPAVGGVGGRDRIWLDGMELSGTASRVGEITWFGRLHGNHHKQSWGVREVTYLKGCNMSYRRELVSLLDPLLSGIVPYGYELDIGLSTRRARWRLVYDPHAVVDHFPTSDMGAGTEAVARIVNHNQTYVLLKHLTGFRKLAFLGYTILVGDLTSIGLARVPGLLVRGRATVVRAHLQGKMAGFATYRKWARGWPDATAALTAEARG